MDTLRKEMDGNRPLPIERDTLGRMVREAWVRWAKQQPSPKPSWLLPYDELSEPDKEADRQIGETIARWTLIHDAARAALSAPQPDPVGEIVAWLSQHESHTARNLADEISRRFGSGNEGWLPIESAPKDGTCIQTQIPGHGADNLVAWAGGLLDGDGNSCGGWNYLGNGEPPDDWTDGVCWESNDDGKPSTKPTAWRLPPGATP